jgi:predicted alpha/beta superfamily hydrolase
VLFDGQNVLEDEGSYAGGWRAHRAVERLGRKTCVRPLILAVGNGGVHRMVELGVGAADFVDALLEQLILPFSTRQALGGPCVLGGASLGGLAALVGWQRHPQRFSGAIAMSPSLWYQHHRLLRSLQAGAALPSTGRLYLDAGARERGRMYADAELLAQLLQARGWGEDRLRWHPDPKGAHQERHWRRRLPAALRFHFPRQASAKPGAAPRRGRAKG